MEKIAFIGGGNMAFSIVGGLVASGRAGSGIAVIDTNSEKRAQFEGDYGVNVGEVITKTMTACRDRAEELGKA